AGVIIIERKAADSSVAAGGAVKGHRVGSNGGVLSAAGVEQKRCRANCGIGICVVEGQRSTANTGIEVAGAIGKERTPTEPCISSAGSERKKRIASFRCREIGKASVRRGIDRPRSW